jgi:MFS family permease
MSVLPILDCSCADLADDPKAPTIYKTLGFGTVDQLALACGYITGVSLLPFLNRYRRLTGAVSLPSSLVGAWIMDRVGRRPILLVATAGCCCCLILETALVATYATAGTNHSALSAAVVALYLFIAFYSGGIDTCGFVYYAELFPNHLRAKGLALAVATFCITDIVYLQVSPTAFADIGWRFYLVCPLQRSLLSLSYQEIIQLSVPKICH